jgi:xanthine dehydrogenase accessory factor
MKCWGTLEKAVTRHGACVLVTVVATKGSVPRGTDAWMIVTPDGFHGSIGGGTVEWKAMAVAQSMLASVATQRSLDYVLGPDLGQCCGGRMQIQCDVFNRNDLPRIIANNNDTAEEFRHVYLFGAGHVGRAVVLALAPLPLNVMLIDPRPNAFPSVVPQNVALLQLTDPVTVIQNVLPGSIAFVMSHSHALDLAIVDAALRNQSIAYVGLIGSATKRAQFEKRLHDAGVSPERIAGLICPIGISGIDSKHPAAIAAGVVAQVLQLDSALRTSEQLGTPIRAVV